MHDNLRKLAEVAQRIISQIPDSSRKKTSPRDTEYRKLIATDGGGGRERARLHDKLNSDMMVFSANTAVLVSGVADLFDTGGGKGGMNMQALTVLVRAPVEMAAQMLWLLDADIDADERVRRYLMWRLSDRNSQRKVVEHANPPVELVTALDERETKVLGWIKAAKWDAHGRGEAGPASPPALLDTSSPDRPRRLAVPKIHELVGTVASQPLIYAVMSVPSHGDRWAVMETLEPTGAQASDGRHVVAVAGFALDPNMVKVLALHAVALPAIRLADWNGVNRSLLQEPIARLNAVMFT